MTFKVIVTTFNSERWIAKCLKSIRSQTIQDFNCVFVDDASTDNTYKVASDTVDNDRRFKVLTNQVNMKQMRSINRGIMELRPKDQDVIVQIDGDDWLKHEKVLERVQREYNSGAWLTYGQFEYSASERAGPCGIYPLEILKNRAFREYEWIGSHLKTFRYFLFKRIDSKDFLDSKEKWLTSAADMAFMFPMLEMAGTHIAFIPDVLYVYNQANPLGRNKIASRDQKRCDGIIRAKQRYPLSNEP